MKQNLKYFYCLIIICFLSSCGDIDRPVIVSFSVLKENNPGLLNDITGVIDANQEITVDLPNRIDLSSIVANFEVTGSFGSIVAIPAYYYERNNEIKMISGETQIDFTKGLWEISFKDCDGYPAGTYVGQYFINVGFPVTNEMIPDESLLSILKKEVGKDSFYTYDLNDVYSINDTDYPSIQDFTGLEYTFLLGSLIIHSSVSTIESIKTIKNHECLNEINFYDAQNIIDFSPISDFPNLRFLIIQSSNIESLIFLSALKDLEYIEISSSSIDDYSAISTLINCSSLNLSDNSITDISVLSNLTNCKDLDLSNNNIIDISTLSNLTNCKYLDLRNNNITDISTLSNLTKIESIQINGNGMDLTEGSNNKLIVDQFISNGCNVHYNIGNIID